MRAYIHGRAGLRLMIHYIRLFYGQRALIFADSKIRIAK